MLFLSAFVIIIVDSSEVVSSQSNACSSCAEKQYTESEEIFRYKKCGFYGQNDCLCYDEGDRIFAFHATDANCEEMSTEDERFQCYNKFAYNVIEKCEGTSGNDREACLKSYFGSNYQFYTGPGGTFVNKKAVIVNGNRSYFVGYDNDNKFKFKSGFIDPLSTLMTFRKDSRDVEIGGTLNIPDGDLEMKSYEGGVYFGAYTEYDDVVYEVDSIESPANMGSGFMVTGTTCVHDCDFDGQRDCDLDYKLVCRLSGEGCYEWEFNEYCTYGCANGACLSSPTTTCSSGAVGESCSAICQCNTGMDLICGGSGICEQLADGCNAVRENLGVRDYCTDPACPCGDGQGDCDYVNGDWDGECIAGTVCTQDRGNEYGYSNNLWDFCETDSDGNGIADIRE